MATSTGKIHCDKCGTAKATYKCEGCAQRFSFDHLVDHRQALDKELNEVEHDRNEFRESLTEQTTNPQKHSLIQRINKWQEDSIKIIEQTADETRQFLLKHIPGHIETIEIELAKFTEQLKEIQKENDFNEIHLEDLKEKLRKLRANLDNPPNVSIQEKSSSFINKIFAKGPQFAASGAYEQLPCQGRHCANCGKCRDWYYTGDLERWHWIQGCSNWKDNDWQNYRNNKIYDLFKKRTDGATCTYLGGLHLDHRLCLCEDNCHK